MADLKENATKSGSQSVYTPPRVIRIGDTRGGIGGFNCSPSGSTPADSCLSGATARLTCAGNGADAHTDCNGAGSTALAICDNNGSDAITDCRTFGNTYI